MFRKDCVGLFGARSVNFKDLSPRVATYECKDTGLINYLCGFVKVTVKEQMKAAKGKEKKGSKGSIACSHDTKICYQWAAPCQLVVRNCKRRRNFKFSWINLRFKSIGK